MRRPSPTTLARAAGRLLRRRSLPPPLAAAVVLALLLAYAWSRFPAQPTGDVFESGRTARVVRVVDGDTLLLEGDLRVRLLGVDTPETKHPDRPVEHLGPEAAAFTERLVEGKDVRLEFDRERRDRYGRALAYVYVGDVMLNEALIREGFSRAETGFPYRRDRKRLFRDAEAEARASRRGLWADGG